MISNNPSMTIVIDTSTLLGDPTALAAFPGSDVVLPLTVIEELDRKKDRLDEVGAAARSVIRELEELRALNDGNLHTSVPYGDGGTLRIKTNGLDRDRVLEFGFDVDRPDNRILAACLGIAAETEGEVTLVSNDVALRIKAAQIGLSAADHAPTVIEETVNEGWTTIDVPSELIDQFHTDGHLDVSASDIADKLTANQFAVLRSGPSQSALVRRRGDRLVGLNDGQVRGISPRNKEQRFAFDLLADSNIPIVALEGIAGTGKTMLAILAGLEQTTGSQRSSYGFDRVAVYRPMISVEKDRIGFLPGELDEKLAPWFEAITDTLVATEGNYGQAKTLLATLLAQNKMTFGPVTYLRGRTLHNTFIVVDEAQNLEVSTLKTILTRVGKGSRIVFTGDTDQIDHPYLSKQNNALSVLRARFDGNDLFGHVTLTGCERSEVAGVAAHLL